MNQLIELVTVFPEDTENKKRCQNHPFVACEILSESGPIHDKILEDESLLSIYFSFLNSENPHSTLIGYFCKTLLALITRSSEKTILYMRGHNVFDQLLQLLSSKGVLDVVLKILLSENTYNAEVLEAQKDLFRGLVTILNSGNQLQTVNAAAAVQDLLSKIPDYSNWKDLVQLLVDPDNSLKVLFQGVLSQEDFRVAAAGSVLRDLLNTTVKANLLQHFPELNLVGPLAEVLPQLEVKLRQNELNDYVNTMKVPVKPLGEGRLRIVEVISSGLKQDNETLFEKIAESGVLRTITALFFDYPWNSIFHNVFDGIIQTTLLNQNPLIVQSLLTNPDLVQKIIKTCEASEAKHRLGNLGFVHKLANRLKDSNIGLIKEFLASQELWQGFVEGYLSGRNAADQRQLGVVSKHEPSSSSDEPEVVLPSGNDRAIRFNSHDDQKEETDAKDEQDVDEPDNVEDKSPTELTQEHKDSSTVEVHEVHEVHETHETHETHEHKHEHEHEHKHDHTAPDGSKEPEASLDVPEAKTSEPESDPHKSDHESSLPASTPHHGQEENKSQPDHHEPHKPHESHEHHGHHEHHEPHEPHQSHESHKASHAQHEDNRPVSPLEHSPLARRRSNSGSQSPQSSGNFNHVNFWKIDVLVDELDGLELD